MRIAKRLASGGQRIGVVPFTDEYGEEIDRSKSLQALYEEESRRLAEYIRSVFPEVPIVLADNVAEDHWCGSGADGEIPSLCLPPFPAVWVETAKPDPVTYIDGPWGCLFLRTETHDKQDDWRWGVEAVLIFEDRGSLCRVPWSLHFLFNAEGQILVNGEGLFDCNVEATIPAAYLQSVKEDPQFDETKRLMLAMVAPFFLTFAFMHFKDVKVEPQEVSRQVRRQGQRRAEKTGEPFLKFYVLNIKPMQRILDTKGRRGEVGTKRAFHLCRGHYREYTPEHPAFGKYVGRVWVEAHFRGSKKVGEVRKDYKVEPPKPRPKKTPEPSLIK
jgi:hypothetical protein